MSTQHGLPALGNRNFDAMRPIDGRERLCYSLLWKTPAAQPQKVRPVSPESDLLLSISDSEQSYIYPQVEKTC